MSLNEDHSRAVRARKCNSNYRQGWDESLTQESRHPKGGPLQHICMYLISFDIFDIYALL